ncbi:MAG TPA: glutamate--tRNA ligase, partial [Flavisolibacter sp.]|nr:glutamate--tRNA ligase [Flavisolibacter sp.]
GEYAPYRQSERKAVYRQYAEQLIEQGNAYYAFDTAEELDVMRNNLRTPENPSPQYDLRVRMTMRNSLTLNKEEVDSLLQANTPHVIRIKMPENETISFIDMIRGEVSFDTAVVDDKVLLKADGMPTYHLAVVVDDYLMKITHAFRGEEWLPSSPVHILLWRYLFGEDQMPEWAHLPLILGPSGKLSKRDGARYGFPVFAMSWKDPKTGEVTEGFKEKGFLQEAFVNLLAMLGWNDGTEQEIFSKEELIERFSIEKVHKGGAKFDYEKAKWFNHEWIKNLDADRLSEEVKNVFAQHSIEINDNNYLEKIINLVKERCTLLGDFWEHSSFFFKAPEQIDFTPVLAKWNDDKKEFFKGFSKALLSVSDWQASSLETIFNQLAEHASIKPGELQLPLRLMLVGGKFGPPVFEIAQVLGKYETVSRINWALDQL